MSDMALLRIGILAAGLLLIIAIFFFGRPKKPAQVRRKPQPSTARADAGEAEEAERIASDVDPVGADAAVGTQGELGLQVPVPPAIPAAELGKRPKGDFDKLVTLYVAARPEQVLRGEDIVVAAEKTGLVYGYMNIFHRLVEGQPERGPVFSMASILKPGSFDMASIGEMETPAIAFFLTLPGPLGALDAWETMEPTVSRMAELLDAVVLDDSRNALGRQRIAHIRDELRAYDRQQAAAAGVEKPGRG